jgi:hypothetical protein
MREETRWGNGRISGKNRDTERKKGESEKEENGKEKVEEVTITDSPEESTPSDEANSPI